MTAVEDFTVVQVQRPGFEELKTVGERGFIARKPS